MIALLYFIINQTNCFFEDAGKLPVFEPGLEEIIKKVRNKNLHFSNEIEKTIENSDIIFLCVNTPVKDKGFGAGQASDLKFIEIMI